MSLTVTIPGAVEATTGATAPATLTVGVGVPGATGAQGPAGQGVPTGGTAGQFLTKIDGTNYNTDWTTVNFSQYLTTSAAAATYQPLSGMSSYLTTSTASTTYAPLASPTFTGTVTIPAGASISGYLTTSSASSTYAPLASPTFTGVPAAPTAAANTNTTQVATTAFVLGQGNSTAATIAMNGTQAAGTSNLYARADHIHPSDTTKANLASPTFTGTPAAPTAVADTNTTQIATTAFVIGQSYLKSATASSTYAPIASPTFTGTVTIPAGASISGFAPLASPTFTGTPAAPTAAVDTNTTQIATTAYVVGQGYLKSSTATSTYAPLASPALTGTPTAPTATAGTNTTQIATTAFVTAAVPTFGATADINSPSSTTKAASIDNVREMMLNPGYQLFYLGVGVSGTALSGYYNSNGGRYKDYQSSTTSGSYGQWCFDTNSSSQGYVGFTRGQTSNYHDWSKKIWLTGRCQIGTWNSGGNGDVNGVARIGLGGRNGFGSGDFAVHGIGWKVAGGGTSALVLTVHNGSTLTNVTSSFTPTLRQAFDWKLYSDGAGNVTLYVNDSQVATTSSGPTGNTTNGLYFEGVDAIATVTTVFTLHTYGTKIYHST